MSLESLKEAIKFTRGERQRLKVLIGIIILLIVVNMIIRNTNIEPKLTPKQVEELYSHIQRHEQKDYVSEDNSPSFSFEKFNPNTVSQSELIAYGWPIYPARNLVNYRQKGGVYRVKSDLQKVYGMTDELYAATSPFIDLPNRLPPPPNYTEINPIPTQNKAKKTASIKEYKLQSIDPNTVSQAELTAMGISKYVAKNWISFREKGKVYRNVDDISKIYGMDPLLLTTLQPHLLFPEQESKPASTTTEVNSVVPPPIKVNLNQATSEELQNIKGIGPAYSKAILKYRDELGGYYSAEQLYEITWIPKERIDAFISQLSIDDSYRRINVKETDFNSLKKHPYIKHQTARIVKTYFKLRPQDKELDRFIRTAKMNRDTLNMLRPYLELRE